MKTMYLTLNEDQFARINGTYEEEYIQELAEHMMKYVDLSIIEEEFHELTNFEYAKQNNQTSSEPEGYQNHWNHKPYFYHQSGIWYYVDQQEYAHPIADERTSALKQLNTNRIFEDAFHQITQGKYHEYLGLAYLPEEEIIEEKKQISSLEGLYQQVLKFSQNLYYFLEHQDITDNRSIRSLSEIFIKMGFLDLSEIPKSITNSLLKDERSGDERSINLILELISKNFKV